MADPPGEPVRPRGETVRYEDCNTEGDVIDQCSDADVLVVFKHQPLRLLLELLEMELTLRVSAQATTT